MADRITQGALRGMLTRATRSGRAVGALTDGQELTTYVPWSHAVIVVRNVDGTGGVSPVTSHGGSTRELYEQAFAITCAFELVEQANGRHVPAMARAVGIN